MLLHQPDALTSYVSMASMAKAANPNAQMKGGHHQRLGTPKSHILNSMCQNRHRNAFKCVPVEIQPCSSYLKRVFSGATVPMLRVDLVTVHAGWQVNRNMTVNDGLYLVHGHAGGHLGD